MNFLASQAPLDGDDNIEFGNLSNDDGEQRELARIMNDYNNAEARRPVSGNYEPVAADRVEIVNNTTAAASTGGTVDSVVLAADDVSTGDDVPPIIQDISPIADSENDSSGPVFSETLLTATSSNKSVPVIANIPISLEEALEAFKVPSGYNLLSRSGLPPLMDGRFKKALKSRPKESMAAAVEEVQKFIEKGGFKGVDISTLTEVEIAGILPSMMFITDKYDANGHYDKTKARLVGGGHMQNIDPDTTIYSPTLSTFALFTVAAIACKKGRVVEVLDIGSAYLNAPARPGSKILMRLDRLIASILVSLDNKFAKFVMNDGSMIVHVLVAIYGCKESAMLWYEDIDTTLTNLGYIKNPYEKCIYNFAKNDVFVSTVGLYVDDIYLDGDNQELTDIVFNVLFKKYGKVTRKQGKVLPFLGMILDFSGPVLSISMPGYMDTLLEECGFTGTAPTPATEDLFRVCDDAPKLPPPRLKSFHKQTAKLLYASERAKPVLKVSVSFLTTRVREPDIQDELKLKRVFQYLNGSKKVPLRLSVNDDYQLVSYVDASYGIHADGRSHSGLFITLGGGSLMSKSVKQQINTKSSSESELIAVSDMASNVIHARNFMIAQGFPQKPTVVYQDNMSTLTMIERGSGNSDKSKHINIRNFWVTDRVKSGELKFEYMPTSSMLADILTKPLQGALFRELQAKLMNEVTH